jgi:outer membrane biosynthesis protein TonB
MRNTLLITASVAALMAGIGLASAQGMNERREAPAAAAPEQKAPEGQPDRQKPAPPQKSDSAKPTPTAQAPERTKPGPAAQAPERPKPGSAAQAPEKATGSSRPTVGQSPSQRAAPNAAAPEGSKSGASTPLSTEQHAKIRDTLRGEKVKRLNNVQFSISVGEAVPRSVHFYRLPARIVRDVPQYRGYDYIMVGDDILILDPRTHRIVAVIPA